MWPFNKQPPKAEPPRIEVVRCESTSLRLEEWRSQPELVAMADTVWRSQDFRLMFQVAQTEGPGNFAVLSGGVEARALHQARTEGYNLALANLKAMRVLRREKSELESEYAPEEQTV